MDKIAALKELRRLMATNSLKLPPIEWEHERVYDSDRVVALKLALQHLTAKQN